MALLASKHLNNSPSTSYKDVLSHKTEPTDNKGDIGVKSIEKRTEALSHRKNFWSDQPMLDEGRLIYYASKNLPESVSFIPTFLATSKVSNSISATIKQVKSSKNLIFIPVILKNYWSSFSWVLPQSFIPRHLVVIVVDKEKKHVEYFDPKGINPYDEKREINGYEGSLSTLIIGLKSAAGTSLPNTKWNPTMFQEDHSSCGFFGAHFMMLRSHTSFEEVISTPMDIKKIRETIDSFNQDCAYTNPKVLNEIGEQEKSVDMDFPDLNELFDS